jgi:hypothetical protein
MEIRAVFLRAVLSLPLLGSVAFVQAQTATGLDCAGCVGRDDIATGAVTTAKIGLSAVTTTKIGLGAVSTPKIKSAAVTLDKLSPDVQARLLNGAITVDQLSPDVQARLLDGAITIDQLSPELQSRLVPAPSGGVYAATSLVVECSGTGTPLADALSALNPAAAVYDVQISGTCEENLELFNFHSLVLRSADPALPATIGRVLVSSGTYAELSSIRVKTVGEGSPTGLGTPVVANYGTGRLQLQRVEFVCSPATEGGSCEDLVIVNSGDGRLNGLTFSGPWAADAAGRKGGIAVNRGANAIVQPVGTPCLEMRQLAVSNMATLQVADGAGCDLGLLRAVGGGTIVYSGGTADVEVQAGHGHGQFLCRERCMVPEPQLQRDSLGRC